MRTWRVACLLIGILALLVAALPAGSALAAWLPGSPEVRGRLLFLAGMILAVAAVWGRGPG